MPMLPLAMAGAVVLAMIGEATAIELAAVSAVGILAAAVAWACARSSRGEARDPLVAAALDSLEQRVERASRQRHDMRMRAQTAGRFREEFVAAVRHELKTPLNSILGFTQVLLDEIDGPLTDQQREDVTAIRQAGLYLSELVEAVLDEWEPDRATPLPLHPVDMALLVREVGRLLEGQTIGKDVTLRMEIAERVPKPLGDARRLRQVLINLGTNALRATSHGAVTFALAADPEGVRITVRDTGTGIAPDALPHLFEEFTQAGPPSTQAGGSGLGLALTRDLVDWHAGRIEVESTLGAGSTFHVILPLEPGD